MTRQLKHTVLAITALMVLSVPPGAFAAPGSPGPIPSLDGNIYACYKTHNDDKEIQGELRVVSGPAKCKTSETSLSWSAQGLIGPQGPIGVTGDTGAQGPIGPIGVTGDTGAQGPIGVTGDTGPQGPIGVTGDTGAQGPIGVTGAAGTDGADGAQGPIGLTGAAGADGADGAQGIQGVAGNDGATGAAGADGADGAQGDQGIQGPIGVTGDTGPAGADSPLIPFVHVVSDTNDPGNESDPGAPGFINGLMGPHIIFEGANIHVRSGSGLTDDNGALTNKGNLIIGYNEFLNDSPIGRGGSHNLIVGPFHSYSSHGGFVAGFRNAISNRNSSVSGGIDNTASGSSSSVSGGAGRIASGADDWKAGSLFEDF